MQGKVHRWRVRSRIKSFEKFVDQLKMVSDVRKNHRIDTGSFLEFLDYAFELNITSQQIADATGSSLGTVQHWKCSRTGPSKKNLLPMLKAIRNEAIRQIEGFKLSNNIG